MPLPFHNDRHKKMQQQRQVCRDAMLPMLYPFMPLQGSRVLELGCGEAGILARMVEEGATGVGLDLNTGKISWAQEHFAPAIEAGQMRIEHADIFEWMTACGERFDIIVLKDVIEHVPSKRVLLMLCRELLRDGGVLFVGFPPWRMPFGGHQQMAETTLGKLPWMHLLPEEVYSRWLQHAGENGKRLRELLELPATGLGTRAFERLCKACGLRVLNRRLWLINPIYRSKFGLPQVPLPWPLRCDVLTTAAWYVLAE